MDPQVKEALQAVQSGKLVAIPTETVYGLAAPIDRPELIEKIFLLKKRPFFDPLIVHISELSQLSLVTDFESSLLSTLAHHFWPGPLSIVVPKKASISGMITSGLETVAVRMPDHPLTLQFIKELGQPVAAPSANLFGKTSPTKFEHVVRTFDSADVFTINGGDCRVGIESTVVKIVSGERLVILRPGFITKAMLQAKVGNNLMVSYDEASKETPGALKHHYMPEKPLILASSWKQVHDAQLPFDPIEQIHLPSDPVIAARTLYDLLRQNDQKKAQALLIILEVALKRNQMQNDKEEGLWFSILDRLSKAATFDLRK
jgi:L-threonylcarbamoyladenylate synthase